MDKNIPNWVIWKAEKRAGKITKIPYSKGGSAASSTDPQTWLTHKEALEERKKQKASGIGFVLPLDGSIIGIDLDKCYEDGKFTNKKFEELIKKCDTYTEFSPSDTGFHLFFKLKDQKTAFDTHRSKKCPGFEIYQTGRYFTYTEKIYEGRDTIKEISSKDLHNILKLSLGYPWKQEEKKNTSGVKTVILSEQEILDRMFNAKNGKKVKALYEGDLSDFNNDTSSGDISLCMHLAFWTQKDANKIKQIWLSSPLGNRKKTQERVDYQESTIKKAIGLTSEVYSPRGKDHIIESLDLMVNEKNVPFKNSENILRILRSDELLSKSLRHNAFTHDDETNIGTKYQEKEWHPVDKSEISFITLHIQRNYAFFENISKQKVEDAILVFCSEKAENPVYDWVSNLEWDGNHRLDHWLSLVYGTPDDAYHSAVGANWFKGLVKRVVHPGSKFDHLIILEGPQGWKKSSSLRIIGKEYHVETVLTPDNKDFFMLMKSNIIVEFSEGHTMGRADTRLLKSVITVQDDQYRVPFGRNIQKYPRHCVFAMTTNESQYLRDETGNRRFLPVEIQKPADIEWLEQNIDQLYAEAYQRVIIDKEIYWDFPEEEMSAMQASRMIENAYSNSLIDWYASLSLEAREKGITALDAYQAVWVGDGPQREMHMGITMQVTAQLSAVLKLKKRIAMVDGNRNNRWFSTPETQEVIKNASDENKFKVNASYEKF